MEISFLNFSPKVSSLALIAPGVKLIGQVKLDDYVNIWYNSILRADLNFITIGKYTNIQDLSLLHVDKDEPLIVGNYVTIGHRAVLHGCKISDYCLIGMGAIILNKAEIGEGAIIGAGALITQATKVKPNTLYVGIPAKEVKVLSKDEIKKNKIWAENYYLLAEKSFLSNYEDN